MIHDLKIQSKFYEKVLSGEKTFEIRFNDRNYSVGDILILNEILDQKYTGNKVTVKVVYMLNHEDFPQGIPVGYVVMGIKREGE